MLLWTRGLIRLVDDDALTGYDELTRGLRRARGRVASAFMIDHLFGLHADLAMHAGETLHSTRILALAPEGPSVSLSRARQDLLVHEPSRALDLALRARASSRTERQLVGASLTAAIAADRLGLAKESGQHARRAVDGLRRNGLTSPLAFLPRHEAEPLLASHGFEWPAHIDKVFFAGGAALTPRELLVLRHLGSGASLSAIAQQLFVSPNTVKTQVKSVYRKLGVSQRAAAVAAAQERGLL
jgi:LuxR family maltose regulon positive regulatory protein